MEEIIFFAFAVLISSFISGMTGLGGGILLLSVMIPLFPISVVIPLHGVIQFVSNSSRVLLSLNRINYRILLLFTCGAVLGSLLTLPIELTHNSTVSTITLAVAIIIFTWVPLKIVNADFKGKFILVGSTASFLSTFIGTTGPLTAPFFLNSKLDKTSYVPTKSACQLPIHLFKVILYILSGFILKDWITYIVIALPIVILGNVAGKLVTRKVNGDSYKIFVKIIITVVVGRMLIKLFI